MYGGQAGLESSMPSPARLFTRRRLDIGASGSRGIAVQSCKEKEGEDVSTRTGILGICNMRSPLEAFPPLFIYPPFCFQ